MSSLNVFEILFGYHAKYFVSPNGSINTNLNEKSAGEGIKYRSTSKTQYEPLEHMEDIEGYFII